MREVLADIKTELKSKLLFWKNIQSKKIRIALIFLLIGLVGLKVFTTVLTFDWLASLFS